MRLDRYEKSSELWYLLHRAEQLVVNDPDYHPNVRNSINNALDIVETVQRKLEASGQ